MVVSTFYNLYYSKTLNVLFIANGMCYQQTRLLAVQLSVGVVSDFPLSILNTIERNYPRQIFLHKYWRYIKGFDGVSFIDDRSQVTVAMQ